MAISRNESLVGVTVESATEKMGVAAKKWKVKNKRNHLKQHMVTLQVELWLVSAVSILYLDKLISKYTKLFKRINKLK